MTIPADVNSVSKLINHMIGCLRALPHIRDLEEPFQAIADMQIWLLEERGKPWTAQEDSGLQGLQDVLLNDFRLAEKWKRLRLLFEPSTFAEKLRNTFTEIRDSCDKLQVPSKSNIVEQLDKVVLDLSDGGDLSFELNRAETEFKKQFFDFLRENRSKSATSEDVIYVRTWLAEQLGTDVDQEWEEIKEHGGTLIEELILYITELEERKCTVVDLVAESSEERIKSQNEGGESSDASFEVEASAKPLDVIVRDGVQALKQNVSIKNPARVYQGFAHLTKCTKLPGGKFELFKAGAIAEAIRLANAENGKYTTQAVKLLAALTSSREGVALGSERDDICIEVSDHVEVLIEFMKRHPESKRSFEARLLAAETVVNILVNEPVWQMVRSQYDIVSALLAISNEHPADRSIHDLNRADRVCLLGLTRLTEFSNGINLKIYSSGDKTQIIVTVLMKLIREGLMDDGEANLAKDSLVALDTQVLLMGTPVQIWTLVRQHMSELMVTDAFVSHSSVPGRMAIVSIMTKVCPSYKEDITEDLILYLLKLIKSTGHEICMNRLDLGEEQVEDGQELLSLSIKLLCFCVTNGKKTVQCVLSKYPKQRATLLRMFDDQDSGISNEFRLEIMDVLDKIDDAASSQNSSVAGGVAKLVKMLSSSSPASRRQIASRILKCVKEQRDEDLIDMKKPGVIGALVGLLKDENEHCQQDALLALDILSPHRTVQSHQLPDQTILGFLSSTRPEVRDAAIGLLELMVKENAIDVRKFMETPEALQNTLGTLQTWLDENPEGPDSASSQKSASALLKMATEAGDDSVRLGILTSNGLSILIKYVQRSENCTFKELLTTMLSLICKSAKSSDQEAVIDAGGHIFLLSSLRENVLKEIAAQGLLSLVNNTNTRGNILEAGLVKIAVESVDQRFASTDIARILDIICSTPEGMHQIYTSNKGVRALLILLEYCPELQGQGAAATVIARLYPDADLERQTEMTDACKHLIRYVELDDKSQLCCFLKALAALATGRKGRQMIHEELGIPSLIDHLKNQRIFHEVPDLMLKILVEISHIFTEVEKRDSYYCRILNVFLDRNISTLVSVLSESEDFNNNTESVKNLLILIKNFSTAGQAAVAQLSGQAAVAQLSGQGAVDVLLKVLKQHKNDTSVSDVTMLAVEALEKFMDERSERRAAFIKGDGIQLLIGVLKLQTSSRGFDDNCYATKILTSVVVSPDTRRVACDKIFSFADDIFRALNTILNDDATSELVKWQAAVLIKALAMYGPKSDVCSAIIANGCLDALNQLRGVKNCEKIADDALRVVRDKSKECRKKIDGLMDPRR